MATTRTIELAGGSLHLAAQMAPAWELDELCDFASRQNPKRAFLFVSKVLGKHIPAKPSAMRATHDALATQLTPFLTQAEGSVLFLGFAETATGFGAGVHDACRRALPALDSLYSQTTRYRFQKELLLHFQEEHSHATGHLLYAPDTRADIFFEAKTLVLLDDELTTGKTNINFLQEFLAVNPNIRRVALVSLLNWMTEERRQATRETFPGVTFEFCALMQGSFEYEARPDFVCPAMPAQEGKTELKDTLVPASFGRFGSSGAEKWRLDEVIDGLALNKNRPVHVIGDGEFLHPPYLLAERLEQLGYQSFVQSTTRSPVLVGGAMKSRAQFDDHYADGITNFLYNAPAPEAQVVFCHESRGDHALLSQLGRQDVQSVAYEELLWA